MMPALLIDQHNYDVDMFVSVYNIARLYNLNGYQIV
jgi:hypothetical protein